MLLYVGRPKKMSGHEGIFFKMLDTSADEPVERATFLMSREGRVGEGSQELGWTKRGETTHVKGWL